MITILASWLNYPLFQFGGQIFSLWVILKIICSLIIVILISRLSKIVAKRWLLPKLGFDVGNREAFSTLIAYFLGVIGTLIILQSSQLNLASLAFLAGGLGIGIGFGLQSITRDFISGLILLLGRSIKIGDFIEFGTRQEFSGLQGTIKKITPLFTVIQTKDGGNLILPNSYLVIYPILNWSYEFPKNRIKIPIKVYKNTDLLIFTETVLNLAFMEKNVLKDPRPCIILQNFGKNYCEFELRVWIDEMINEDDIKSKINYAIDYYLRQQGIQPYYPDELWLQGLDNSPANFMINNDTKETQLKNLLLTNNLVINHYLSIRDLLKQVTYFEDFNDLQLRQLIEVGYRRKLAQGEVLFNEGDVGDAFYIILSGAVEVYVPKLEKHLATLQAGSFFGELALMLGIPRTASIRGIEASVLFALDQKGFQQVLQENRGLTEIITQKLSKHQEELSKRKQELHKKGLITREEDDSNLVLWVSKRLNRLFALT
jgi:small-conductance mechanosensitive channel